MIIPWKAAASREEDVGVVCCPLINLDKKASYETDGAASLPD
jgi:hypothetical protein